MRFEAPNKSFAFWTYWRVVFFGSDLPNAKKYFLMIIGFSFFSDCVRGLKGDTGLRPGASAVYASLLFGAVYTLSHIFMRLRSWKQAVVVTDQSDANSTAEVLISPDRIAEVNRRGNLVLELRLRPLPRRQSEIKVILFSSQEARDSGLTDLTQLIVASNSKK